MIGQMLSHFEVLEKVGEGGMGVVYRGRDRQLNRNGTMIASISDLALIDNFR